MNRQNNRQTDRQAAIIKGVAEDASENRQYHAALTTRGYAYEWNKHDNGVDTINCAVWQYNGECGKWRELSVIAKVALSAMSPAVRNGYLVRTTASVPAIDRWHAASAVDAARHALTAAAARLGYRMGEDIDEWTARAEADAAHQSGAKSAVERYQREYGEMLGASYRLTIGADIYDAFRYAAGDTGEWYGRAATALSDIMYVSDGGTLAEAAARLGVTLAEAAAIIKRDRTLTAAGRDIVELFNVRGAADVNAAALFCVLRPFEKGERKAEREKRVMRVFLDEAEAAEAAAEISPLAEVRTLAGLLRAAAGREEREKGYLSARAVSQYALDNAATDGGFENLINGADKAARRGVNRVLRLHYAAQPTAAAKAAAKRINYALIKVDMVQYKGVYKPNLKAAARLAFPDLGEDAGRKRVQRQIEALRELFI